MDLKNKKVFITGADGFIGSHLTEYCLEKGCKVKALSYYNSFNFWGWLEDLYLTKNLEIISGDVRDPYYCLEVTKGVDIIFHLAALITIPFSYRAPHSYVETNVNGTLNICNASLKNKVKRVLVTSTSEVYGTARNVPINEEHPKQPQSPYSASKIAADAMAMSFYNAFSLPVVICRPFNTFGPRQSARAIIPTIIAQILSGEKVIRLGDLTPTRDFNYVKDICAGLIALAECDEAVGKEVNISSNKEVSVGEIFNLIKKIMDVEVETRLENNRLRPKNSEVYRLRGDNTLMKKLTGWTPKYGLKEGLKETIHWYSDPINLIRYKISLYNI